MSDEQNLPAEEYAGPATLRSRDSDAPSEATVEVSLAGHFEPIDGHFHWYGRIGADSALHDTFASGEQVEIDTGERAADGRLSDIDPWGRFRITGVGAPPF